MKRSFKRFLAILAMFALVSVSTFSAGSVRANADPEEQQSEQQEPETQQEPVVEQQEPETQQEPVVEQQNTETQTSQGEQSNSGIQQPGDQQNTTEDSPADRIVSVDTSGVGEHCEVSYVGTYTEEDGKMVVSTGNSLSVTVTVDEGYKLESATLTIGESNSDITAGEECTIIGSDTAAGEYSASISATAKENTQSNTYRILISRNESDENRLTWTYTDPTRSDYVDHGKIYIEQIVRDGSSILSGISNVNGVISVDNNGTPSYGTNNLGDGNWRTDNTEGYFTLKNGDVVTIRLIPTYGYQIKSATLGGMALNPNDNTVSQFTFTVNGTMAIGGSFVKASDQTDIRSTDKVTSAGISNGQNAADSGNLKLTVGNNDGYDKVNDALKKASEVKSQDQAKTLATLELGLKNIVSKGNGEYWEENITSFTDNINVELAVPGVGNGQSVAVVRDHNGTLDVLDASYDPSTGKVSIPTNQFSTYSIIVLGDVVPVKPAEKPEEKTVPASTGTSKTEEATPIVAPVSQASAVAVTVGGTKVSQKDMFENAAVAVGQNGEAVKLSDWNQLAAFLATSSTKNTTAAVASGDATTLATKPVELVLGKKDTVVPENVFVAMSANNAPSLHMYLGNSVAINFINDAKLKTQKAVDLSCTILSQNGGVGRIIFKSDAKLSAVTSIHATAPKDVLFVNIYRTDKTGKRTLISENVPVVDGRFCFLIDSLGIYDISYQRYK